MKLDNFQAVYSAALQVARKGESLVCEGDGVTLLVRPVEGVNPEIDVARIDGSCCSQSKRFGEKNFPVADFIQMNVAQHYLTLL